MSVIQRACQNLLEPGASLLLTAWTYLYMPHLWETWLEFQINESDSESSKSENIKKNITVFQTGDSLLPWLNMMKVGVLGQA